MLLGSVSEKAEVTDAHEVLEQDVEEETADELLGIESDRLFSVPVLSISIAQGDFSILDFEDTVIGESHAMSVAAEVIEDGLWGPKGFFA